MTLDEALAEIDSLKTKNSELTSNLTNQRKTHEKELEETRTKVTELEKTISDRDASAQAELTKYSEDRIKAISKGDETIAAKIKEEYGILNMPEDTREGIDARALKAYQAATLTTVDPLAQRVDTLPTDTVTHDDGKMAAETTDVYKRMFPHSEVAKEGAGE